MKITLIGYGEVGQIFARELKAQGAINMRAFDIVLDDPQISAQHRAVAAQDGIHLCASAAEAQRKFGGDSVAEFVRNAESFRQTLP